MTRAEEATAGADTAAEDASWSSKRYGVNTGVGLTAEGRGSPIAAGAKKDYGNKCRVPQKLIFAHSACIPSITGFLYHSMRSEN